MQSQRPPWRAPPPSSIPRKRHAPDGHSRQQNDAQEAAWVAGEDRFVLAQAKKKAQIRVKEGRARPIDWLAVTLRFIDQNRSAFDDEIEDTDLDVVDPEGILDGLNEAELKELEGEVEHYRTLESNRANKEFWDTLSIICRDRRRKLQASDPSARVGGAVSAEVDRMFSSKTLEELERLEKQIKTKLRSDEDIDVDYWEHLLKTLQSWKARAKLRNVSQSIVRSQLDGLKRHQQQEAARLSESVLNLVQSSRPSKNGASLEPTKLDPEAMLRIRLEDKGLEVQQEKDFIESIDTKRTKLLRLGYIPAKQSAGEQASQTTTVRKSEPMSSSAQYDREVARGVNEDEEVFAGEETVVTKDIWQWEDKYRPRKPRYFNRVQMGYEWNKYNQTHYDHDNPPPKVVQGYKFNVFYPDLIDKQKAPTYKIERENGRRKGQSFAPAGAEDTCLIRFVAGAPYEDIAFRIVDKEWDYSAKRDRGFKSSFDKVDIIYRASCSYTFSSKRFTIESDRAYFLSDHMQEESLISANLTEFTEPVQEMFLALPDFPEDGYKDICPPGLESMRE